MLYPNEYGLYIHIPFCERICSYCDFFVDKDISQIDKYVSYLVQEIEIFTKDLVEKPILKSIYFGGGTPSLLSPEQFKIILDKIDKVFAWQNDIEISIESNPNSLSLENLIAYRQLGINRLSVGVQSFNKQELGVMKRNHSPKRAIKALQDIQKAGFDNYNLDIIFSVPNQTLESLEETLKTALNLNTTHFSAYSLIYEEGTPLYKKWKQGLLGKKSDDEDAEMYSFVIDYLTKNGFEQYEVSNFAKDGKYCKHNLWSWHSGEYFAFGVSSHGYLSSVRFKNFRNLNSYYKSIEAKELPREASENLTKQDKLEEFIFLSLRADGTDIAEFKKNFGFDIAELLKDELKTFFTQDLIILKNSRLSLTKKGYLLCDSITFKIISDLTRKIKHEANIISILQH